MGKLGACPSPPKVLRNFVFIRCYSTGMKAAWKPFLEFSATDLGTSFRHICMQIPQQNGKDCISEMKENSVTFHQGRYCTSYERDSTAYLHEVSHSWSEITLFIELLMAPNSAMTSIRVTSCTDEISNSTWEIRPTKFYFYISTWSNSSLIYRIQ